MTELSLCLLLTELSSSLQSELILTGRYKLSISIKKERNWWLKLWESTKQWLYRFPQIILRCLLRSPLLINQINQRMAATHMLTPWQPLLHQSQKSNQFKLYSKIQMRKTLQAVEIKIMARWLELTLLIRQVRGGSSSSMTPLLKMIQSLKVEKMNITDHRITPQKW